MYRSKEGVVAQGDKCGEGELKRVQAEKGQEGMG